jgi:DNA-binding transcriptional MerR regulator
MSEYTVSEMVEVLVRNEQDGDTRAEKGALLLERIRYWTREGLIFPKDEKNPGTGRHRRYDESALLHAAVLNGLADLGVQLRQQRQIIKYVKPIFRDADKWREFWSAWWKDPKNHSAPYLLISNLDAEKLKFVEVQVDVSDGLHTLKCNLPGEASILLNLSSYFLTVYLFLNSRSARSEKTLS